MERKKVAKPAVSQFSSKPVGTDVELAFFRERLRIDKYRMDEAVAEQAQTVADVAEKLALAESRRDQAKENLKTADAEALLTFVETAETKETEKVLLARVQTAPQHKAAFAALMKAEREVGEWQALRDAWKDRSYMVREMCLIVHDERAGAPSVMQSEIDRRAEDNRAAVMRKGGYKG